jgi:hypothetical protein
MQAVAAELRIDAVPRVTVRRRLHGGNQSYLYDTVRTQYLGLLRRSLNQRRARP